MTENERFESWARREHPLWPLDKLPTGEYVASGVHCAWIGWQAATELHPCWKHVRGQSEYELTFIASAQVSVGSVVYPGLDAAPVRVRTIKDGDMVAVYRSAAGVPFVRFLDEFMDGRFAFIGGVVNDSTRRVLHWKAQAESVSNMLLDTGENDAQ